MGGDRLGLAGLLDHEQLRQDGHRLEVDGEGPEDFHQRELVVQHQRKKDGGADQKLNPKIVSLLVKSFS